MTKNEAIQTARIKRAKAVVKDMNVPNKYPPYFKAMMIANEREVMKRLREVTQQTGRPYNPNPMLMNNAWYNAIERLLAKKVIRYSVTKHGGGYIEVKRRKTTKRKLFGNERAARETERLKRCK
jgi:hypothetical protein